MAKPTYEYSGVCYVATEGQTTFALTTDGGAAIGYLKPEHIKVRKSDDAGGTWVNLVLNTDWVFADPATSITLNTGATAGDWIDIKRNTPVTDGYIEFQDGDLLTAGQLNEFDTWQLYIDQEIIDTIANLTKGSIDLNTTDDLPEGSTNLYYTDARVETWINANLGDTDDLAEGSVNLYYTDARVETWINANLGSTDDLSEGSTNLYYTDARVQAVIDSQPAVDVGVTKVIAGSSNVTLSPAGGTGDVTVTVTEAAAPGAGVITLTAGSNLSGGGTFNVNQDTNTEITFNASGGEGGGIPEAPNDGKQYGRQSLTWTEVTSTGGTPDLQAVTDEGNTTTNSAFFGAIDVSSDSVEGVAIRGNGIVDAQRTSTSDSAAFRVWKGSENKITLNADGSATFAGQVIAGGNPDDGGEVGCRVWNGGAFQACRADDSGSSFFLGFVKDNSSAVIALKSDGSGQFAGSIQAGSTTATGIYALNAKINASYAAGYACIAATNSQPGGRLFAGYDESNAEKVTISNDGKATFTGFVNVGGSSHTSIGVQATNNSETVPALWLQNYASPGPLIKGWSSGSEVVTILNNGNATFAGSGQFANELRLIRGSNRVNLGGSDSIAIFENNGNFIINWDGSASFKGNVTLNGAATQYILAPNVIVDSGYTSAKQTLNGDSFTQTGTDGSTTTASIAVDGTGQFGSWINLSSNGKVKVGNAGDANAASIEIVAGTSPAAASYTLINGLQSDGSTSAFDIKANGTLQCVYLTDGSTTKSMTDVLGGVTSPGPGVGFPTGTKMMFAQATPPTGWTIDASNNDSALRIASDSGGTTGGTIGFTSAFTSKSVSIGEVSSDNKSVVVPGGNYTGGAYGGGKDTNGSSVSQSQIGSHAHSYKRAYNRTGNFGDGNRFTLEVSDTTGAAGGGGSHSHSITDHNHSQNGITTEAHSHSIPSHSGSVDLSVKYVNVLIATKD